MLVIGHRGARGHAPENTLLGLARGLDLGADWVEFDVRLVEERFVLMHDDRLERTTNGSGRLADRSLASIRGLDAGEGERVPFLEEALEFVGDRAGANVELKSPEAAALLAEQIDAHAARTGADPARILVSSFEHAALRVVRRSVPWIRLGALIRRVPPDGAAGAATLGAWSVHPAAACVDPAFVEDAHRRGLLVLPYTVNERAELSRLRRAGVDGVFSDYPDRIVAWCTP